MTQDTGVPPSGSGHSAEPEPCSTVSAVPASVPNAACGNCAGEQWVCENHRDKAWPTVCECGAGAPCPVCRPDMANAGLRGIISELCEALETKRDWVADFAGGHMNYVGHNNEQNARLRIMAHEDLTRIRTAFAKATETTNGN